jgi:hypothetical protein
MLQLELGITPLTVALRGGLKVAFVVDIKRPGFRKRKEVHVGVVKWFSGYGVVIEGITIQGTYNRPADMLFEVHKDISLVSWKK